MVKTNDWCNVQFDFSDESEKALLNEAKNLWDILKSRRLPMEHNEIERRITSMIPASVNVGQ